MKVDKFKDFRTAEEGLEKIRLLATKLARQSLSEEAARGASSLFSQQTDKVIEAYPSLRQVQLAAEGPDVKLPLVHPEMTDEALILGVNPELPYGSTGLQSAEGSFFAIVVSKNEVANNKVQAVPHMFVQSATTIMNVPYKELPFMRVRAETYPSFPLSYDSGVTIGVRKLDILREQKDAFIGLSKSGLSKSIYAKKLRALGEALAHETDKYIELNDVSMLHIIGILGKRHAEELGSHLDRVIEPLSKIVGDKRPVQVEAEVILGVDSTNGIYPKSSGVTGRIIGFCPYLEGYESSAILAVVQDVNADSGFSYVPLDAIQKFLF